MKATEIKIGDLVQLVTDNETEYGKVSFIDKDNTVVFEGAQGYIELEYVSPIPLTFEILEKNGWKENRDGDFVDEDHHLVLSERFQGYSLYKEVNANRVWLTTIKFVHQLQHFLWTLDIDDDLKI